VVSACGNSKTFPGTISGGHTFDSYTFTACRNFCMEPQLDTGASAYNLFESAYSSSFDPDNIGSNYAGDAGLSSNLQSFGISTTAGTSYTIAVSDVGGNSPPNRYTIKVPACALNCDVNQLPEAVAHDVSVIAANVGGTADAIVENGSYDPEGGPLTNSQTPPGPYPVGATSVFLTVEDARGAIDQAAATVTVLNPGFSLMRTQPSVSTIAGQSATQHITFTPTPGIAAPLTLVCRNMPPKSVCSIAPSTLAADSGTTEMTLTINTTTSTAGLQHPRVFYATWLPFTGLGWVGITLLAMPRRRRRAAAITRDLLGFGVLALLIACGGGVNPPAVNPPAATPRASYNGTPRGTYTITVAGTSGNLTETTTFSLTVN
jgi:hypothetical protein